MFARLYEQGDGKTRINWQDGESKIDKFKRTSNVDDPRKTFVQGKEHNFVKIYKSFTSYEIYKLNKLNLSNINLYLILSSLASSIFDSSSRLWGH